MFFMLAAKKIRNPQSNEIIKMQANMINLITYFYKYFIVSFQLRIIIVVNNYIDIHSKHQQSSRWD